MKAALFVDTISLYTALNKKFKGRKLDFAKLITYWEGIYDIVHMEAFGLAVGTQADNFLYYLQKLGFNTFFRLLAQQNVNQNTRHNVLLTTHLLAYSHLTSNSLRYADAIILATTDPEMEPVIEYLRRRGKEVFLVGANTPRVLTAIASRYLEIPQSMLQEPRTHEPSQDDNRA